MCPSTGDRLLSSWIGKMLAVCGIVASRAGRGKPSVKKCPTETVVRRLPT